MSNKESDWPKKGPRQYNKQPEEEIELTGPIDKEHDVFLKIDEPSETMYTDQTGAFPVTSIKGNRYVMVATQVDGNAIISGPMKKKTAGDMICSSLP